MPYHAVCCKVMQCSSILTDRWRKGRAGGHADRLAPRDVNILGVDKVIKGGGLPRSLHHHNHSPHANLVPCVLQAETGLELESGAFSLDNYLKLVSHRTNLRQSEGKLVFASDLVLPLFVAHLHSTSIVIIGAMTAAGQVTYICHRFNCFLPSLSYGSAIVTPVAATLPESHSAQGIPSLSEVRLHCWVSQFQPTERSQKGL